MSDEIDVTAVARRWFEEVWNQRRLEVVFELLPPDGVCQTEDGPICGPEEFLERQFEPLTAAFPDLRVQIDDCLANGDQAVVRWSAAGTHRGEALGLAPTGRSVHFAGMSWIRFKNGRLSEGWQASNVASVLAGLGPGRQGQSFPA